MEVMTVQVGRPILLLQSVGSVVMPSLAEACEFSERSDRVKDSSKVVRVSEVQGGTLKGASLEICQGIPTSGIIWEGWPP